ncbi:DUF3238 domain-containing protein [Bradyrhizobium sp. 25ACV]
MKAWILAALCFFPSAANAATISLWVKAFIPSSGPSAIVNVPGHSGQTMLNGLGVGCFHTDGRGFSSSQAASARMTSSINFTLTGSGISAVTQSHATGVTQKVDCASGNTGGLCRGQAQNLGMQFKNIQFDAAQKIASMTLEGAASNPCFQWGLANPAPNIHYKLLLSFNAINKTWGVTAMTGQFPSFEAYMQVDGGPVKTLFQLTALEFNLGSAIYLDRVPDTELTGSY